MPFKFSEQHIDSYYHHGYTVFRGIVPPSLIGDLRKMAAPGRAMAREKYGPQAQRLQPLATSGLDIKAYHDYAELPALVDALHKVLSPRHSIAGEKAVGVFYEPGESPSCTGWHRDITVEKTKCPADEFLRVDADPTFFAQVNCALYTDCCTWYVPGSASRPDLPSEPEAAKAFPDIEGKTHEEIERLSLDYCGAMPGAIQFLLEPGDFALYRPNGWHLGNYSPDRLRCTIHDGVWKPETREWYKKYTGIDTIDCA